MLKKPSLSLDQIDQEHEALINGDELTVARAAHRLLGSYPVLSCTLARGKPFYRGRVSDEAGFSRSSDLSHPPASAARANRLNDAGVPVLYASTRPETIFTELGVREGDFVHIAGFRILADKTLRFATIGELEYVQKMGNLRLAGADPGLAIQRMLNSYPYEDAFRIVYVDSLLGSVLADSAAPERKYVQTRAISNSLFSRRSIDGMFYPSVQQSFGMNLAILPSAVASAMHQATSYVVRIVRCRNCGFYETDIVRQASGIDADGNYIWLPKVQKQTMIVFNATKEEFDAGSGGDLLDMPSHHTFDAGPLKWSVRRIRDFFDRFS